tara:strand:- start:197 stop:427 length:231 start_codon:yes stop_codon:yes gene_type:complete
MKKIITIFAFVLALSLTSCSKDDEDNLCLNCEIVGESFDQLCEGMKDPDTGETLTKELLEISKALFEAFGATCTLK